MTNMMSHGRLNNVLVKVVGELSAAGITSVLLKGQGVAQYYPKPELRQCGDIDLYVGLGRYADSYDVVKPLATEIDDRKALEVGKHYDFYVGKIAVEMHRYSDRYPTARLDRIYQEVSLKGLNENLVPLIFSGHVVYTPSDEYNAFYIFSHLFHHFLPFFQGDPSILNAGDGQQIFHHDDQVIGVTLDVGHHGPIFG